MRIIIIEDEKPALDKLLLQLKAYHDPLNILDTLSSVKEAIHWFQQHAQPDLILCEISLTDGSSFEIFRGMDIKCPIIFITAYDDYLMQSFEFNSIDYLLKPVSSERLYAALKKYQQLKTHFTANYNNFAEQYFSDQKKNNRYVVKKGLEFSAVKPEDIAYFFSEHKISFLIDNLGNKYIIEKTLQELETTLEPSSFFRLNRKYIAHINAIVKYKPVTKGKLKIDLLPPTIDDVIVSQENAADFKMWIAGTSS